MDSFGTHGAKTVATEESQRTPPTSSSDTQNARVPMTRAASARNARALNRDLRDFIGLNRPDVEAMTKVSHTWRYVATKKVKKDLSG